MDSDGDGDCYLCSNRGGCKSIGGPFKEVYCCEMCTPEPVRNNRMILCQYCGSKRCPAATNHNNRCTGSSEPGQTGSSYGVLSPLEQLMLDGKEPIPPKQTTELPKFGTPEFLNEINKTLVNIDPSGKYRFVYENSYLALQRCSNDFMNNLVKKYLYKLPFYSSLLYFETIARTMIPHYWYSEDYATRTIISRTFQFYTLNTEDKGDLDESKTVKVATCPL
jgi:hypothetical protein